MVIAFWNKKSNQSNEEQTKWNARKRYICYRILEAKEQTTFSLNEFAFPFNHIRSSKTDSFELVRIAKCVSHLENLGVTIKSVGIKANEIHIVDKDGTVLADYGLNQKLKQGHGFLRILLQEMLNGIESLTDEGDGAFVPDLLKSSPLFRATLELLPIVIFTLEIKPKVLAQAVANDMHQLLARKNSTPSNIFGHEVSTKVINTFLQRLSYFGENVQYRIAEKSKGIDELFEALKSESRAYQSWQKREHEFDFLSHLFAAASAGKISDLEITPAVLIEPESSQFEHQLKRDLYDEVKLSTLIQFTINPHEGLEDVGDNSPHAITLIEAVEIPSYMGAETFLVYLNNIYDSEQAIVLKTAHQTSQLIYDLCEASDNLIDLEGRKKAFSYINKNLEFVFFSNTGYSHTQLLDKDKHSNIIPAEGVRFRLITPQEEKAKLEQVA